MNKQRLIIIIVLLIIVTGTLTYAAFKPGAPETPIAFTPEAEVLPTEIEIDLEPEAFEEEIIDTPITDTTEITKPVVPTEMILHEVPFTSQAPFAEWDDPMQQDGCEEASVLMAIKWIKNEDLGISTAKRAITAMSEFQQEKYGQYHDTSAYDTADRLLGEYYNYNNYETQENIEIQDIINELYAGNIIIAPSNGQKLGNPHFTAPGPEYHMLVIIGYDPSTKEFITNDPGTRHGKQYRYSEDILFNSLQYYETGYHEPYEEGKKAIITVRKANQQM